MNYNTIHHDIRNKAGLSIIDWCLLETIYNLSNSNKGVYKSWCNASKTFFKYLASDRTILNRFNHLEKNGWMEFKSEKRFLKRTTQKYYDEVYYFVISTKKFRSEEVASTKKLRTLHEEVAPLSTKELPNKYEEVAPNNNKDNNIKKNKEKESKKALSQISELKTQLKELQAQNETLKAEKLKPKEKDSEEKEKVREKVRRTFPSNKAQKSYKVEPPKTESETTKPYQVFLSSYQFDKKGWSEGLKLKFISYCEVKDEKSHGGYASAQMKLRVAEINEAIEKHELEWIEKLVSSAANGAWADFQFDERIKERKLKKKKNEQKQTANNGKSIYENYADILKANRNKDSDDTIDVNWADA